MITVTPEAIKKIQALKEQRQTPYDCLRIALRGGGCSGFMFDVSFVSEAQEDDNIFEFEDIKVLIDKKSYFFVNGMTLGYEESLMKSGFTFDVPSSRSCGCGESIGF